MEQLLGAGQNNLTGEYAVIRIFFKDMTPGAFKHLSLLILIFIMTLLTTAAQAAQTSMGTPQNMYATFGVDYHSRSGNGKEADGGTYTAKLIQGLSAGRSQYFILSYDDSNVHNAGVYDDVKSGTVAYGQVWPSNALHGVVFNLGGVLTRAANDYGISPVIDTYVVNNSVGLIGGLTQAFAAGSHNDVFIGSNFALTYHKGLVATAYPYAEYKHQFTPVLKAYTRMTVVVSTKDANLNGGAFLFMPAAGMDYTVSDYTFGTKYTHEDFANHQGYRIGLTVSRPF